MQLDPIERGTPNEALLVERDEAPFVSTGDEVMLAATGRGVLKVAQPISAEEAHPSSTCEMNALEVNDVGSSGPANSVS